MNTKEILQGIKNWTAGELDTKVDKVTGKGLSTNDYTDSEKNKLAGIASGAEVNVQSDWNATSGDAFIKNKPTIPAAVTESTVSGWGFTKNTGTVTGVKINGTTKEPSSGVVDLGTVITTHQDVSGKVDKTTTVNGHALSDNVSVTKSDVGLGNVGNFKAVSTVASQGLSDTEKSNARSNIGAGTSSFSGSYNDLTNKPTIPSVGNAEVEIQKNGTKVGSFTTNQSGSKVAVNITVPTGTAANKDVPTSGNASTSQVVMGNDSRLTDSRNANDVYSWAKASSKPTYTASEVGAIPTSAKGAASGVATLDSAGKVPSSQLPSYVDDVLEYDTKSAFPTTGEGGKIYVDKSNNTTWRWSGSSYTQIKGDLTIGTTSGTAADGKVVNDHINNTSNPHGVTKAQVGLGSVVNTGDSATPVSGGTTKFTTGGAYTELAKKVDKVSGKGLSTNDYTTDEKNKLGGIASGAEVNQNAFSNVGVKVGNTTTTVAADAKTDTVTLIQGSNVTLTADTTNDTITIAAKDTTYSSKTAASGGTDVSLVTTGEKYTWNNKSNFSGNYNDLTNKPTIPAAANNGTLTIQKNGTNVQTFTANQSTNATANITVPTKVSELTNDSGFTSNTGTVTSVAVKMNNSTKGTVTTSGTIDLGTVLTSHQSVTDSNPTLSWGTKSKVATIGSTAINVTMPSNPNTDKNVKVNTTNPSAMTTYYPVWYSAASGTGELNANDGLEYRTQEGTTSAPGFAEIILGNNIGTGNAGNKSGVIVLYSDKGGCSFLQYKDNATDNVAHILPEAGGTILTSGTSSVTLSGQTLTVKINGTSKSLTNTTYSSKAAASGGSDVSLVTTGEKYTWNNKTSNTGTVTKVTAGTGLTGGDITTTGTIALATSGVTAGTYKRVTVDAYGRVTSGDNTDSDTKNTAGTTNKTGTKMFLAAATEQSANPVTYSNSNCYIGTDNCLYSGGTKVLTAHQNISGKLNKSGDTMTGLLTVAVGKGISDSNGNGMIATNPDDWDGVSSSQWGVGSLYSQGVIRSSNAPLVHYIPNVGSYNIIDASGGTISGALTVQNLEIDNNNEINGTESSSFRVHLNYRTTGMVSICYGGGKCGVGTNDPIYKLHVNGSIGGSSLSIANGGRINVQNEPSSSAMYIGNSNNSGWVRMQDTCCANGTAGDASGWTIRTNGKAIFVSVQQTSDIRKKNIIENVNLSIKDIANAPIFKFTWLDPEMPEGVNVGTSAQYWQTILPEAVSEMDDKRTLSMQYGVAGLVSSVALAKKVVEQEETIKAQEARIKALEDAIANIQNMLNK